MLEYGACVSQLEFWRPDRGFPVTQIIEVLHIFLISAEAETVSKVCIFFKKVPNHQKSIAFEASSNPEDRIRNKKVPKVEFT